MFYKRISNVPGSFIREILKVVSSPSIISFAGALPNRDLFPLENIKAATNKEFDVVGADVFQFSNSDEGTIALGNRQLAECIKTLL